MELELYHPHKLQKEIHDSINNEEAFYYILNIGRQFGKTSLLENQVLFWAITIPNIEIGWVSPVYKQAKKSLITIDEAINHTPFHRKTDKGSLTITLHNGSTIAFLSAQTEDSIRGNHFNYLVCDEFDFIKERVWQYVLRPTLLVKGKGCILASTPKGKKMIFDLMNISKQNKRYKYFKGTSYDNPYANIDELDDIKKTLPEAVWRQEYLAEFVDSASVFNNVDKCTSNDIVNTSDNYIGIDIGFKNDYSVVSVLNNRQQLVYQKAINHCTSREVKTLIMDAFKKYPDSIGYIELNNQGVAIYHDLLEEFNLHSQLKGFTTTPKTKSELINNLVIQFDNQLIQILDIPELNIELDAYIYKVSKLGVIQFEASSGFHDDRVMSLAIASMCLKEQQIQNNFNYGF